MNRLALLALVFAGPPTLYGLTLLIRHLIRQRRTDEVWRSNRRAVTVAELTERIERERAAEADQTDRFRHRHSELPPGWVWPTKDVDVATKQAAPLRSRPYLRRSITPPADNGKHLS